MVLRIAASRLLPALVVAGFASAALPAQAQGCSPCGYTAPAPVYVPPPVQYHQCGHCGNRGLFTSGWVANTWVAPTPCGTCQPVVYQQQYYPQQYQPEYYAPETQYTEEDDDDYTYRRRFHTGPRYRTDGHVNTTRRTTFTNTRRNQSRQCGYINGKWTCVDRLSQQQPNQHQPNRRTVRN